MIYEVSFPQFQPCKLCQDSEIAIAIRATVKLLTDTRTSKVKVQAKATNARLKPDILNAKTNKRDRCIIRLHLHAKFQLPTFCSFWAVVQRKIASSATLHTNLAYVMRWKLQLVLRNGTVTQGNTRSSAMADRPCDCLRPKSPLCSCQHCQWLCAGRDAIAIRQARITRPKRHPPNAYEILVTRYDQFPMRATFGKYFTRKGTSPTNLCCCHKTRMIAISCGIKISAAHHLVLSQYTHLTDRRTDGQTEFRQQYRALHYMQSHGKKIAPLEPR